MRKQLLALGLIIVQSNVICSNTNIISLTNPKADWSSFFKTLKSICNVNTFVETGTYLGDTTALAADVLTEIHTIELLTFFYDKAVKRFEHNPHIHIHLGDSAKIFPTLLPTLTTPHHRVLFWLDGHIMDCQSDDESEFSMTEYTPIMQELRNIKRNNFKKNIILIDDIRLFGTLLDNKRLQLAGKIEYPLLADVCTLLHDTYSYRVIGDILLAYEKSLDLHFSPVIDACTISRTFDGNNYTTQEIIDAEEVIAHAQEQELQALFSLYNDFSAPWRQWYNKSPHYNLWYGLILQHQKDHANASLQFQEVIRLGYNHWRVFWYLAQSLYESQSFDEARTALTMVLKNNPDFSPANTLMHEIERHDTHENVHRSRSDKYVIGHWGWGGMGIYLTSLLNHLLYCETHNLTPVVYWVNGLYNNPEGFNNQRNGWEYYFNPVSHAHYNHGDAVHKHCGEKEGCGRFNYYDVSDEKRALAGKLITKYVHLNPIVQSKVNQFYNAHIAGRKTIAIHLRGTDKHTEERPVPPLTIITEALKYADHNTQFFLATDEQRLLDEMRTLLNGRKVISYDCYRSENGSPLHTRRPKPSRAQLGEDVIVEMWLMSKCDILIRTLSNVSSIPLYINPQMPQITIR
jgi:tetratricopeptide (TPR) repeat protein